MPWPSSATRSLTAAPSTPRSGSWTSSTNGSRTTTGWGSTGSTRAERCSTWVRGAVPEATEHTRIPIGTGICGAAAASGETEIVDDVNADPALPGLLHDHPVGDRGPHRGRGRGRGRDRHRRFRPGRLRAGRCAVPRGGWRPFSRPCDLLSRARPDGLQAGEGHEVGHQIGQGQDQDDHAQSQAHPREDLQVGRRGVVRRRRQPSRQVEAAASAAGARRRSASGPASVSRLRSVGAAARGAPRDRPT